MCAWKYPQEWFEDGDIIEPSDWRLNQQEFLSEANGTLDNDNLYKKTIKQKHFVQNSFNKFYRDRNSHNPYFDHSEGGWLSSGKVSFSDDTVRHLPSVTVQAAEDGAIIVDCIMGHQWQYKLGEATMYNTEYGYYRPTGAYLKIVNAYVQCISYRITCNGLIVCDSGPIGNEYSQQPVYMCGAIPVIAGENKVQVEVRFTWYAPSTDRMIECSSKNPEVEIGGIETPLRKDCYVGGTLIVNHRKR